MQTTGSPNHEFRNTRTKLCVYLPTVVLFIRAPQKGGLPPEFDAVLILVAFKGTAKGGGVSHCKKPQWGGSGSVCLHLSAFGWGLLVFPPLCLLAFVNVCLQFFTFARICLPPPLLHPNFRIRFASKPLFYWAMPSNGPSGAVRVILLTWCVVRPWKQAIRNSCKRRKARKQKKTKNIRAFVAGRRTIGRLATAACACQEHVHQIVPKVIYQKRTTLEL